MASLTSLGRGRYNVLVILPGLMSADERQSAKRKAPLITLGSNVVNREEEDGSVV